MALTLTSGDRRSPIRNRPLPDAGESSRREIRRLLDEEFLPLFAVAVFAVVMAGMEWALWLAKIPRQPAVPSLLAAGVVAATVFRFRRIRRAAERLRLGIEGERAVGQHLQATLVPLGYAVFHDIVVADFNLDHVAVGPGGVFAIEVKTRSKPRRGDVRVEYDGAEVRVAGHAPDRNPVIQARAGARTVREILERFTGRRFDVQAAVVFPGWFVERQPLAADVWVLNEKALVKFIANERESLSPADVTIVAEALARYIREQLDRDDL